MVSFAGIKYNTAASPLLLGKPPLLYVYLILRKQHAVVGKAAVADLLKAL